VVKYTLKSESSVAAGQTKKLKIDYKKELNAEQLAVVLNGDGPCLVLAGAGSGKTRTLVYRVIYLLDHGVKPEHILLVTFTNKAAKEMLARINAALGAEAKGLWGGTFHHIGNRLLRMYGERINIASNFTILDSEDSLALIKSCIAQSNPPSDKYFPKPRVIHSIISLSVNLRQSVRETINSRYDYLKPEHIGCIEAAAQAYQARKKSINALDFDDLLAKWNELLESDSDLRRRLGEKFQYILVDEYQDTNYLQARLVANLAGPQNNVLVVGDDSQSIYGFRGADVNNILDFPKAFKGAKIFHLNANYRSTPEILALANHSINRNENKFEKNLTAVKNGGQLPAVAALTDNRQQAEFVCQRVLDLQRDRGFALDQLAVLFRSHFQCLELEMELNKRNIPYQLRGGLRFFEQAHLKDVLAYLKVIANVKDEVAWSRLLMMQDGIGPGTAAKIWQQVKGFPNLKAALQADFELGAKARSGWGGLRKILDKLSRIDQNDLPALVEAVLRGGYEDYLKANFENFSDRLADLEQLEQFVVAYDNLEKFLADTTLSENFKGQAAGEETVDSGNSSAGRLILSTIHQAKGLEWPAVFVIGLAEGLFPHAKTYGQAEDLEEERRLFYVAVTRAEEQLYLAYPLFGRDNLLQPSQFIKELPSRLYEHWDVEEGAISVEAGDEIKYVDEDEEYAVKPAKNKKKLLDFDPGSDLGELDF